MGKPTEKDMQALRRLITAAFATHPAQLGPARDYCKEHGWELLMPSLVPGLMLLYPASYTYIRYPMVVGPDFEIRVLV